MNGKETKFEEKTILGNLEMLQNGNHADAANYLAIQNGYQQVWI